MHRGIFARGSLEGLEFRFDPRADPQCAIHAFDVEDDRSLLDGDNLTDKVRKIRNGATLFPGPNAQKGIVLIRSGLLVNVNLNAPVTSKDISRDMTKDCNGSARHVQGVDLSFIYMP